MWTDPIYDRTALDITNRTSKAFFNVVDWVRIDGNTRIVKTLVDILRWINVDFTDLPAPTITTIPSVADANDFIANIEAIRQQSGLPASVGIVELKDDYLSGLNATTPDYEDVNDWERDLALIREYIVKASAYLISCGVAEVGQVRFWQNRFREPWVKPSASPARRARSGIAICGNGYQRQNKYRKY